MNELHVCTVNRTRTNGKQGKPIITPEEALQTYNISLCGRWCILVRLFTHCIEIIEQPVKYILTGSSFFPHHYLVKKAFNSKSNTSSLFSKQATLHLHPSVHQFIHASFMKSERKSESNNLILRQGSLFSCREPTNKRVVIVNCRLLTVSTFFLNSPTTQGKAMSMGYVVCRLVDSYKHAFVSLS